MGNKDYPAFSDHQRKSDKSVVSYALRAVRIVEDAVFRHKPQKKSCGNALVTICERMVLSDQVEQHCRFLLH